MKKLQLPLINVLKEIESSTGITMLDVVVKHLRFNRELTIKEIATLLNISTYTVKKYL